MKFSLLLFFVLSSALSIYGQRIDFNTIHTSELIGPKVRYLHDVATEIGLDEIINRKSEFFQEPQKVFSKPASKGATWIYFQGYGTANDDIWLDIHNSNLTTISFYRLNENYELIDSINTGAILNRESVLTNRSTFLFPLIQHNENNTYNYFFKVETKLATELPLFIGSLDQLNQNAYRDNFMGLFFVGGILVLLLYNLFFFFSFRKRIYLFYALHLISVIFVGTYFNNYPIIESVLGPVITHNYASLWTWFPVWTSAILAIEYFQLKKVAPRFRKILLLLVVIYIVTIPLVFIAPGPYLVRFYLLLTVVFYLVSLIMGYYVYTKNRTKRNLLYCIGWTALVIGIVLLVLLRNGIIEYSIFWRNISYFGSFIESLAFAIGIGQYMNDLRLEQVKLNKELKLSNVELTSLNESLDSFNYHVSHDLKTVLNNAKALASMVQKYNSKGDHEKLDEVAEKLKTVTENGVETVQSFLSLGKIDTLFNKEVTETVNLEQTLKKVIESHGLTNKITVSVEENQVENVKMHRKALESIFLNLLSNTIKYSENHPKGEFYFLKNPKKIAIVYKDYGIGIDMDVYGDTIFKPFERGGASTTTEGTGVGLYILHRIVTNYKGTINLQSQPGKGVKFTMNFPNG